VTQRIQFRRGTGATNPVPAVGEPCYNTSTGEFKVGDGTTAFDGLPTFATLADITGKQPLDSDLTAIAALASAANKVPYATGTNTWALADFTAAGRALVDDADAAAMRVTLGATAIWVAGVGNGSTDDRAAIAAADTAAQAANVPVLIPSGTYRVATALTITSPVVFQPGAKIKPDSGITVTLSGGLSAPMSQIFDHSAGGTVVPLKVDFYRPQWWGATGGSNDTTAWTNMGAALTAAVVALGAINIGNRVLIPAGINRIVGVTLSNCSLHGDLNTTAIVPPNGTTSGTVLTLGDYARIDGANFRTTESGQAVTLLSQQGVRSHVDNVYINPNAANSVGWLIGAGSTISPNANNVHVISSAGTPASGSIGVDIQSPDLRATNIEVALCDTGIKGTQAGAAQITNLHVWSNNTGISGNTWDKSQISNFWIESQNGWGINVDKMDMADWQGYLWSNGLTVGSTGGAQFTQTSGAAHGSKLDFILDDNVGTGLKVNGPDQYEIHCGLWSSQVAAGNPVVTTTGVEITSASGFGTKLLLRGTDATTPLVNGSGDVTLLASLDDWANNSATSPLFTTIQLGHASDTTISRSAAGQMAVEGVDVLTTSNTQSPTNKTFDNSNTFTVRDDRFTMQDDADNTKQLKRDLSPIPTGVTRKMMMPVSSTAQFSLANSTTQTDIISMTLGSAVLTAGATFRIKVKGTVQVKATSGTLLFKPYLGGTVAAQTFQLPNQTSAAGPVQFWLETDVTVRTTGAGGTFAAGGSGLVIIGGWFPLASTTAGTAAVDTTVSSPIVKLAAVWATADVANVLLVETATIEQVV
jgi:hypothetical protein